MLKQLMDSGKTAFSVYRRLVQSEENIKKLEERASRQEEKIEYLSNALKDLLYDIKLNRVVAERDRENLLLRLENVLLKSGDQRTLPSGASTQNMGDHEARIAALEREVEELKRRLTEQDEQ